MENAQQAQDQNPPSSRAAETEADDVADETVSYNQFKSVKDDMHRYKEEARKAAELLKQQQEKEMRAQQQWKELAEAKEREASEWKMKYEARDNAMVQRAKISAVREAALKLGLVESAIDDLELMDLKDVVVETTSTGRVNVMGARSAAERIKSIRPHWFSAQLPNVNGRAPEVKPGQSQNMSYNDLFKLEEQAKKSGDYSEYNKAIRAFKSK